MKILTLRTRVIKTLLNTQYANMLEYRIEIALWALSGVLPFIMLTLWSQSDTNSSFGFSSIDLSQYFQQVLPS